MNRIEILALPSGQYMWILHHGQALHASETEYANALDCELAARLYAVQHYDGVAFVVEHAKQIYP